MWLWKPLGRKSVAQARTYMAFIPCSDLATRVFRLWISRHNAKYRSSRSPQRPLCFHHFGIRWAVFCFINSHIENLYLLHQNDIHTPIVAAKVVALVVQGSPMDFALYICSFSNVAHAPGCTLISVFHLQRMTWVCGGVLCLGLSVIPLLSRQPGSIANLTVDPCKIILVYVY